MKKRIQVTALIGVIALSTGWAGWKIRTNRSQRPIPAGLIERSKVDSSGHTRGIVQVDLMRQIMAEQVRSARPAVVRGKETGQHVPSQDHPLLGRPAPVLILKDVRGKTWNLGEAVRDGPVVIVFYLGATCMACVSHLTEMDVAISEFRARGARVWAVSGDTPEFSLERIRRYGDFQIPLLSDGDRAASSAFGVWKEAPTGGTDNWEAQHGTFIVDRDGLVHWAYVSNRPFTDIDALLTELDGLQAASSRQGSYVSFRPWE